MIDRNIHRLNLVPTSMRNRFNPDDVQFFIDSDWVPTVQELDEKIATIEPNYKIRQVKEKFGFLEVYIDQDSIDPDNRKVIENLINDTRVKLGRRIMK